ncbi:MAG: aromatic ring-hydroxylating dioxygenase subunit alpha [Kiloniellales bacterium]|nr:aromatic ring-hydroxylating dioxygenase subunit alpha [Kiloniellales bacterium]
MDRPLKEAHPPYGGYHQTAALAPDAELTHVGPATPGGEYLRRFWHPVALASEVGDLPRRVRVLGEDLVLFRDGGERFGLLHRHCPHRGASLEYGICEARGLRCCYHGWLIDVDGTILETPGEPAESTAAAKLRQNLRHGAYPVVERDGLVFAYLGPPEETPAFPVYDTFDIPGVERVPYARDYPCNWLQITENAMDPVHAVFLHARVSGPQFAETWGRMGVHEFHERESGFYYTNARRVGDNIWVRIHEVILPNLTHAGAVMSMNGETRKLFGRNSFTRWVVPVDNETTRVIAWANFGERTDPARPDWMDENGIDVIEGGERRDRSAEEAQRRPADYEAFVGQGPITVHAKEHLMSSDRGVALFRTRLRSAIRALAKGEAPFQPAALGAAPIPTYCGDTVLRVPPGNDGDRDERELILDHSRRVMAAIRSGDGLRGEARDAHVIARLEALEAGYS